MDKGFTVIEMVVIFGILTVISATLIVSLHTGEQQIVLFKEQAQIISVLSRAKSLSISTFGEAGVPCGYGVHFEAPRTYIVFKDLSASADCSTADHQYSGNLANNCETEPECVEKFDLDPARNLDSARVVFKSVGLRDIVFIPPSPTVIIDSSLANEKASVVLKTKDGTKTATIEVNSAGQISTPQ